jgi:hypothetical protein
VGWSVHASLACTRVAREAVPVTVLGCCACRGSELRRKKGRGCSLTARRSTAAWCIYRARCRLGGPCHTMLCGAQAGYAATGMGEGVSGWDSLGDDRLEVQHDGDHGAGSAGRALSAIPMTPPSMTDSPIGPEGNSTERKREPGPPNDGIGCRRDWIWQRKHSVSPSHLSKTVCARARFCRAPRYTCTARAGPSCSAHRPPARRDAECGRVTASVVAAAQ